MTRDQADNWRQFAMRMAFATYRNRTPTRRAKLIKIVGDMIDVFLSNYQGKDLANVDCWDGSLMQPGEVYADYRGRAAYPCDSLDGYLWDWGLRREDYKTGEEKPSEFADAASCCVRAGFDVAIEPSAGVLGFDMGDMRAMFPEGFPPYVVAYFSSFQTREGRPVDPAALSDDERVWL